MTALVELSRPVAALGTSYLLTLWHELKFWSDCTFVHPVASPSCWLKPALEPSRKRALSVETGWSALQLNRWVSCTAHLRFFMRLHKVKLPVCVINWALCYEDLWLNGGIAPSFLTLVVHGGEWLASCLVWFTLEERAPSPHSHCIGGRVGPRAGLDEVE
jgi:hypothetical protein